ncbi:MAG: lamin tail domain-containing protein [Longimicrobiaceae bacterium]
MRSIQKLGLAALALLAACADRGPLEPDAAAGPEPATQRFECLARVRDRQVTCATQAPVSSRLRGAIIGGQGQYVRLTSSNVAFNASTGTFSFDETVQNLLPYAIGTLDGVNPDPAGIRVFFHTGPTVTSGWGTVTVQNADGVGVFTATSQPYFQYPGILAPNQTSAAKSWQFHVDPDVAVFAFTLFVSAHTAPTLVINEIMAHPATASEPAGEWFEVHNRSSDAIDLQGWTIASGGDAPHTITTSLVVGAHAFVVLGLSADSAANGGLRVDYVYSGIDLANGTGDWLALHAPAGFTADSVDWGAAPAETASPPPTGISLELDSLANDNTYLSGASSHWVPATAAFGTEGQLGTPGGRRLVPLQAISVAGGGHRTCAIDTDGQAWCWGRSFGGDLGFGDTAGIYPTPQRVRQPEGVSFTQVSTRGRFYTCALTTNGEPYCWGRQVPLPTGPAQRSTPWPLTGPPGVAFTSLEVARDELGYGLCALDTSGQLWCWRGGSQPAAEPLVTPEAVTQFAIDEREVCVRSGAGNVYCRTLGVAADTFIAVQQPKVTFQWVDTNDARGCAVSNIGQLQCWSARVYSDVAPDPSQPASVRFGSVTLGGVFDLCAVATTGELYCGGSNQAGHLGDGSRVDHPLAPVIHPSGVLFSSVAMSANATFLGESIDEHTCALRQGSGDLYCWGANGFGQLGDGTFTDRLVPTPVYR